MLIRNLHVTMTIIPSMFDWSNMTGRSRKAIGVMNRHSQKNADRVVGGPHFVLREIRLILLFLFCLRCRRDDLRLDVAGDRFVVT